MPIDLRFFASPFRAELRINGVRTTIEGTKKNNTCINVSAKKALSTPKSKNNGE